ncbi:type II CAAX endopeptidase family protein [Sphingomonas bacterium]|uniref:CPBP family intramembrane glutamic endopeptidase n=1 Tax=Sphingomonas bacterium TaxID=1895847 RepID=UPI002628156C|nr:type II CAAX endopeptidase family protein [Sphingomonas bacterium]MDB5677764.1 family intrarane metalloprotease [Sphingomonas bacterium]
MDDQGSAGTLRRIMRYPATLLVLSIFAAFVAGMLATLVNSAFGPHKGDVVAVLIAIIAAAIFVAVYAAFCLVVEGRPVREFALNGAVAELGAGLGIGLVLFSSVVAVIALFGGYRVIGYHDASVLIPVLGISIVSGFTEEIMLRGWFFRLTEKWLGSWAALALSAALFGALHLGNPNATLLAGAAIALEAGIMLAAIYMITRRLWAAIGLHAAWNFAQGGIYGIPVSGGAMDGILRSDIRGSDLLTGGAFGAEASLPAMVIATAFGIVLLIIAYRRGRFMAPIWRRQRAEAERDLTETFG